MTHQELTNRQNIIIGTESVLAIAHALGTDPVCSAIPYQQVRRQQDQQRTTPLGICSMEARIALLLKLNKLNSTLDLPESLTGLPILSAEPRTFKLLREKRKGILVKKHDSAGFQYAKLIDRMVTKEKPSDIVSRMWVANKIANIGYGVMPQLALASWWNYIIKELRAGKHVLDAYGEIKDEVESFINSDIGDIIESPIIKNAVSDMINSDVSIYSSTLIADIDAVISNVDISESSIEASYKCADIDNTTTPMASNDDYLQYNGTLTAYQGQLLQEARSAESLNDVSLEVRKFLTVFTRYEVIHERKSVAQLAEGINRPVHVIYGILRPLKELMGNKFFNKNLPTPLSGIRKRTTSVSPRKKTIEPAVLTSATPPVIRTQAPSSAPVETTSSTSPEEINKILFGSPRGPRQHDHYDTPVSNARHDMSFPAIYEGLMGKVGMIELFFTKILNSSKATPGSKVSAKKKLELIARIRQMSIDLAL